MSEHPLSPILHHPEICLISSALTMCILSMEVEMLHSEKPPLVLRFGMISEILGRFFPQARNHSPKPFSSSILWPHLIQGLGSEHRKSWPGEAVCGAHISETSLPIPCLVGSCCLHRAAKPRALGMMFVALTQKTTSKEFKLWVWWVLCPTCSSGSSWPPPLPQGMVEAPLLSLTVSPSAATRRNVWISCSIFWMQAEHQNLGRVPGSI